MPEVIAIEVQKVEAVEYSANRFATIETPSLRLRAVATGAEELRHLFGLPSKAGIP
jgi:hypothetical protein